MSRVQLVNTLALAHPCLLAGPEGVGPFHCPAEPINTMRCCHALMNADEFNSLQFPPQPSCFRRPDQITTPVAVSPIVRCIPARHLSRPHAAHSIRRYHDGKARNDAGPWRDQAAGSRHSLGRPDGHQGSEGRRIWRLAAG